MPQRVLNPITYTPKEGTVQMKRTTHGFVVLALTLLAAHGTPRPALAECTSQAEGPCLDQFIVCLIASSAVPWPWQSMVRQQCEWGLIACVQPPISMF
jgi:hypothetical protein